MIDEKHIEKLAQEALRESDRYLVNVKVNHDNVIHIVIDSDTAVGIEHCIELSRYIENRLDREREDFELNVMSSGLDHPFHMLRQYKKFIGKPIQLLMQNDKKIKGILLEADESQIVLQEQKEIRQKKKVIKKTGETLQIPMSEIKQAKAVINFN